MFLGDRLRAIREAKNLSQGHIEKRSGLMRSYVSRVECGYTVPAVETLEKWAHALGIPLYQVFYQWEEPPPSLNLLKGRRMKGLSWGRSKKDLRFLKRFYRILPRIKESDRRLLLHMAQKMAKR